MLFNGLRIHEKNAVFVLVALCMPRELAEVDEKGWPSLWCYDVLGGISKELGLSTTSLSAYIPLLLLHSSQSLVVRQEMMQPYLGVCRKAGLSDAELFTQLLVFLVGKEKMDGRGLVLMRNLAHTLSITSDEATWLMNLLVNYLITQQQEIAHVQQQKDNKYRYVKVGAVALGAGALIAFTAGLVRAYF